MKAYAIALWIFSGLAIAVGVLALVLDGLTAGLQIIVGGLLLGAVGHVLAWLHRYEHGELEVQREARRPAPPPQRAAVARPEPMETDADRALRRLTQ
jgi:hypothetical protein